MSASKYRTGWPGRKFRSNVAFVKGNQGPEFSKHSPNILSFHLREPEATAQISAREITVFPPILNYPFFLRIL